MAIFGLRTHFKKFSLCYFCPLTLPMPKNWVKMVPKQVFIGAGTKRPPPTARDAFERVNLASNQQEDFCAVHTKFILDRNNPKPC